MRLLKRNQIPFWYCLYKGKQPIYDADGYDTGETALTYAEPVKVKAHITAASGDVTYEQFGIGVVYDKVVQLDGTDWDIDEQTVLFVDKDPPATFDAQNVPCDYTVTRVSKSLNFTSLAIKKVR